MELWSIYDRPADHPGHFAVLKLIVEDDGLRPADWQLFDYLIEARSALARRGLTRVPPGAQDEPALIETWL